MSMQALIKSLGPPRSDARRKWPFVASLTFQGIPVDIEQRKGDTREGVDKDGTPWKVKMLAHYGEIRRTADTIGAKGMDGDRLDVYVGPDAASPLVVVVDQRIPETGEFDEQKVMLGFSTVADALACYRGQYTKPGFLGGHTTMTIDDLKARMTDPSKAGVDITKALGLELLLASLARLNKAAAKPPSGFTPNPHSKHGGWHKQIGAHSWEEWYPHSNATHATVTVHRRPPDFASDDRWSEEFEQGEHPDPDVYGDAYHDAKAEYAASRVSEIDDEKAGHDRHADALHNRLDALSANGYGGASLATARSHVHHYQARASQHAYDPEWGQSDQSRRGLDAQKKDAEDHVAHAEARSAWTKDRQTQRQNAAESHPAKEGDKVIMPAHGVLGTDATVHGVVVKRRNGSLGVRADGASGLFLGHGRDVVRGGGKVMDLHDGWKLAKALGLAEILASLAAGASPEERVRTRFERMLNRTDPVRAEAQRLLDATWSLAQRAQRYHWNVTGPTFSELHELFGEQYDEANAAVDEIAERMRAMGIRDVSPRPQGPAHPEPGESATAAAEQVRLLLADHREAARIANNLARAAEDAHDAGTVDLAGRRALAHEKAAWMLDATMGPDAIAKAKRKPPSTPFVGPKGGKWANESHTRHWSKVDNHDPRAKAGYYAKLRRTQTANAKGQIYTLTKWAGDPPERVEVAHHPDSGRVHLRFAGRAATHSSHDPADLLITPDAVIHRTVGVLAKRDGAPEPRLAPLTEPIAKAGPYIGPHGGKWADPAHTIPWRPETHGAHADAKARERAAQAHVDHYIWQTRYPGRMPAPPMAALAARSEARRDAANAEGPKRRPHIDAAIAAGAGGDAGKALTSEQRDALAIEAAAISVPAHQFEAFVANRVRKMGVPVPAPAEPAKTPPSTTPAKQASPKPATSGARPVPAKDYRSAYDAVAHALSSVSSAADAKERARESEWLQRAVDGLKAVRPQRADANMTAMAERIIARAEEAMSASPNFARKPVAGEAATPGRNYVGPASSTGVKGPTSGLPEYSGATRETTPRHIWKHMVLTATGMTNEQAKPYEDRLSRAYANGESVGMFADELKMRMKGARAAAVEDSDRRAIAAGALQARTPRDPVEKAKGRNLAALTAILEAAALRKALHIR